MNRKNMPLILMLAAGAVTCIISFIEKFSIAGKMLSLFVVLVVFYFLGSILRWTLDYFDRQNEKRDAQKEDAEQKIQDGETSEDTEQSGDKA